MQIVFEGKSDGDDGGIALDDIFIRTDVTCAELLPTTPSPTTEATTPSVSPMDCTFEDGEYGLPNVMSWFRCIWVNTGLMFCSAGWFIKGSVFVRESCFTWLLFFII